MYMGTIFRMKYRIIGTVYLYSIICMIWVVCNNFIDTYLHVLILHVYTCLMIFSEMIKHDANLEKPIDIFAIGFEEIVDLNASNIMKAR